MTVLEIKRGIAELPDDAELYIDDGYIKAVDMPIELLKQKPCKEQEIYEKAYKESYDKGYSDGDFIGANRWIPVSERLPEVGSEVLVCFDFKGKRSVYISDFYGDGEFHGLDDEYLTSEGRKYRKAVAWMPLPKPYRVESEDKE